jgi:hypothetical protein
MQVAMAVGRAFAFGKHPDVVLAPEAVMDVQMAGKWCQRLHLFDEIVAPPVEVEFDVAVAEVERGEHVGMIDRRELSGEPRRRGGMALALVARKQRLHAQDQPVLARDVAAARQPFALPLVAGLDA